MSIEEMNQDDRNLLSNLVMGMHEYGKRLGEELHEMAMEDLNARHFYEKAIRLLGVSIPRYADLTDAEREDVRGWSHQDLLLVLMRHRDREEDW